MCVVLNHRKCGFQSLVLAPDGGSRDYEASPEIAYPPFPSALRSAGGVSSTRWVGSPWPRCAARPAARTSGRRVADPSGWSDQAVRWIFVVKVIRVEGELVEAVHGRGGCSSRSPRWFLPNWPVA